MSNPPNVAALWIPYINETQLSILMPHFHIIHKPYPSMIGNNAVYSDLKNGVVHVTKLEDLPGLTLFQYIEGSDVSSSSTLLQPFPGSETVTSLRLLFWLPGPQYFFPNP